MSAFDEALDDLETMAVQNNYNPAGQLATIRATVAALERQLAEAWLDRDEAVAVIVLAQRACSVKSPLWSILDDYDGSGDSIREVEELCRTGAMPNVASSIFRSKREPAEGTPA